MWIIGIGWLVDAVALTVSISAQNMLKTVHAFFGAAADVSAPISLQVVERMASLSLVQICDVVHSYVAFHVSTARRQEGV
jgi:hypothetical protein